MNRLKELRKDKKVTQQNVADSIGITRRGYQNLENGVSQIKPDKAQALADFFGVSVGYLLGYETEEKAISDLKQELIESVKQIKQYRMIRLGLDDYLAESDVITVINTIFD